MKRLLCLFALSFLGLFAQTTVAATDVTKTVEIGTPLKIGLISTDGTSPFTYQWQKNGIAIAGATNSALDFGATTQNSAGIYTLIVTNAKGSTTSNKYILSISITISPANAVIGTIP